MKGRDIVMGIFDLGAGILSGLTEGLGASSGKISLHEATKRSEERRVGKECRL